MRRAGILRALALLLGTALAWDATLTVEAGLKAPPPGSEAPAPAQEPSIQARGAQSGCMVGSISIGTAPS